MKLLINKFGSERCKISKASEVIKTEAKTNFLITLPVLHNINEVLK
ncbi:MAG: hypothetical protein PHF67_05525 [Candidatus Nanoarchaeia archaeon]|nr:hypothetical protein [Candidatus Nanoarchaeia archaeon]